MGPLRAEDLLAAYAQGIFPMAESADATRLYWFDPPERGILPVGGVHVSRQMRRLLRRSGWRATVNTAFAAVVAACADRPETWISAGLARLYQDLHRRGHAHSLEVWEGDALVGGVFGVSLGAAFFAESMFSRRPNGSKAALIWLSWQLAQAGFSLWDTQYMTAHLASMGGQAISRTEYRHRLAEAISRPADLTRPVPPPAQFLLQDMTHTS